MSNPDYELDLCGESCPYPVIHTLEALYGLQPGEVLEVTTDCPQAFRNIPDDSTAAGHEVVGEPIREGGRMIFNLRRGEKILGHHLTADNKVVVDSEEVGVPKNKGWRGLFRRR